MNRIYRLVFNRSLGLIQVVAEIAKGSGGKGSNAGGTSVASLRPLSFALWTMLGFVSVIPAALPQVVGDRTAPGNQQPTVLTAPNGVPLVNIQTPSAAGVSRNTYSQFDVDRQGLILNNSRTNAQTQLGGWVQGNPWLATGTAKVILNEVNSSSPSYLNGYIEVAGTRATVVIANPAGIQANGGGFINASRVTLTTGAPMLSGGTLEGYRVQGGAIVIDDAGLDTTGADYTDLIARSLQLNGGLWANQLQATLGTSVVSADHSQVTATTSTGTVPTFALDASALGGMYANKITLVGTEHGVGARNAGTLGAQAGDLVVTVDGRIENTGALQSSANTHVSAAGGVANAGTISATRELTIDTPLDVDNSGGTLNAQRIEVNAASLRNRGGAIQQTGTQALALNAGALSNRDGGRIGVAEPTSGGSGSGSGGSTGGSTGGTTDGGGTGGSTGGTPVVPLAEGQLNIAGLLDNDGGRIIAGGGIALDTTRGLNNDGGQMGLAHLTLNGNDLSNVGGTLDVIGDAQINVNQVRNDAGHFTVGGALDLSAQAFSNRGGEVLHSGTTPTALQVVGTFDNTDGRFSTNADTLAITAGTILNANGRLEQAGTGGMAVQTDALSGAGGTIATAGALTLHAGQVDHQGAALNATQVAITANGFDNRGGSITLTGAGANTVTVAGTLDNGSGGTIASNGDLALNASTFKNEAGSVQHAGVGTLAVTATTIEGTGGTLVSNGTLTVTGETVNLRDGTTQAQAITVDARSLTTAGGSLTATGTDALQLQVRGTFDNTAGTIGTNGALALAADTLVNRDGSMTAAGAAPSNIAVATMLDNTRGTLAASDALAVATQDLINLGGTLQSASALTLTADGHLDNSAGGTIASGEDLTLTTPVLDNTNGTIQQAGDGVLAINAATVNGTGGTIASNGALALIGETTDLRNATTLAQRIVIDTGSLTTAGGTLHATGTDALTLTVRQVLDNTAGEIGTNGALALTADQLINRDGTVQAAGIAPSQVSVTGAFDNTRGVLLTNGTTNVQAGALTNASGTIQTADALQLTVAGAMDNQAGLVASGGNGSLQADTLDNRGGTVNAGGRLDVSVAQGLDNAAGVLASTGDLTAQAGTLTNIHGGVIASIEGNASVTTVGRADNAGGIVQSAGTTTVTSSGLGNAAGAIVGATTVVDTRQQALDNASGTVASTVGALNVRSGALNNDAGLLQSAGAMTVDTAGQTLTNTNAGTAGGIISAGTLDLATGDLDNRAGVVYGQGTVTARTAALDNTNGGLFAGAADLQLDSTVVRNTDGTLQAGRNLTATVATTLDNTAGLVLASGELTVTAQTLVNRDTNSTDPAMPLGLQADTVALNANRIDNTAGLIAADSAIAIAGTGTGSALDNTQGAVSSAGTVDITEGTLTNTGGTLLAGTAETITANSMTGDGRVLSQGDLTVALQQDFTNTGEIIANGTAQLGTAGDLINQGTIRANDLTVSATHIDNAATGEISGDRTHVVATDTVTNRGLIDGTVTRIDASTVDNVGTGRIYGDHLSISAGTVTNREETINGMTSAGTIAARDRLDIGAGTVINREDALIFSAGSADDALNIGGSLDADGLATGRADLVHNASATIESLGGLAISATALRNTNEHFVVTEGQTGTPTDLFYIQPKGDPNMYLGENFIWEDPQPWVHSGRYVWNTDPAPNASTELGVTPMPRVGALTCSGSTCTRPAGRDYPAGDPVWSYFGITEPDSEPVAGDYPDQASFDAAHAAWQTQTDQRYTALDAKIASYNNDFASRSIVDWTQYDVTQTQTATQVTQSEPALIRSGGNMWLTGDALINDKSQIIAGGSLLGDLNNLQNIDATGESRVHQEGTSQYSHQDTIPPWRGLYERNWDSKVAYTPADEITTTSLNIVGVQQNTNATGSGYQVASVTDGTVDGAIAGSAASPNGSAAPRTVAAASMTIDPAAASGGVDAGSGADTPAGPAASGSTSAATATSTAPGSVTVAGNLWDLPTSSLFRTNTGPGGYLIETDPRFANYRNWLRSDYMLGLLGLDPANLHKRLGDGFYEQRLIRDQVAQLTGLRFLDGYASDEEQYRALLQNGATFAQQWSLRPGIGLSAAQIAQLTSDIVWLVEETVRLPDGTLTTALVPRVYLRPRAGDLHGNGTLIAAEAIGLDLDGDLVNGGTIAGRTAVQITADNIRNLGGRVTAANVRLDARTDFDNIGGTVDAADNLVVTAQRDINLVTTTQSDHKQTGLSDFSRTNIDRVAGLYVTNPGGTMALLADRNVNANGAQIVNTGAGGQTYVGAKGNINLGTVTVSEQNNTVADANNYIKQGYTRQVGTTVQTTGDVALVADGNFSATAAHVTSEQGGVTVVADGTVGIRNGEATQNWSEGHQTTHKNAISSTTRTTVDTLNQRTAQGSTFSGETVDISGDKVGIQGSNVVSTYGTSVSGTHGVEIVNATNETTESHDSRTTSSGVFAGSGGLTWGSQKKDTQIDSTSTTAVGSMVGSLQGDTRISSDEGVVHIQGSTVSSPEGDIAIKGQSVNIEEAYDTSTYKETNEFQQSGLTVGFSSSVIDAALAASGSAKTVGKSNDDRVNAMAAANAAYDTYQAAQAVASAANGSVARVSLTVGSQQSKSEVNANTREVVGSSVNAGGVADITATGAGENSTIRVSGSDVYGGTGTNLSADGAIDIVAAQSTYAQQTENSSAGWNAGLAISAGSNGWSAGITAGGNVGRGGSDGQSVANVNSHVGSGGTTTVTSGGTTTIRGGQVTGNRVEVNADKLVIESLQDTDTYASDQMDASAQVTVGYGASVSGSYSQSKIDADYASVTEQSGILAGNGGYAVNIKNSTDLKGGIVTSTQAAEDAGRNHFSTGTLTASDIENHADYEGSSFGIGGGMGMNGKGDQGEHQAAQGSSDGKPGGVSVNKSIGFGSDSDHQSSTTHSGINTANIAITDVDGQAATGRTVDQIKTDVATVTTTDTVAENSGALVNKFDENAVQKELDLQVQVTQAFDQNRQEAKAELYAYAQAKQDQAREIRMANGGVETEESQKLDEEAAGIKKTAMWLDIAAMGIYTGPDISTLLTGETLTQIDLVRRTATAQNKIVVQQCQASGQNCTQREVDLKDVAVGPDGKIYVFNNGIFNKEEYALATGAKQNSNEANAQGVYYILNPYTGNPVAEMFYAGYDKLNDLLGGTLPLTSAEMANQTIIESAKTNGGIVDSVNHSRGGMTWTNAMQDLKNQGKEQLPIGSVRYNGAAANAQEAADLIRDIGNGYGQMYQSTHPTDIVGRWLGNNPATGEKNDGRFPGSHSSYTGYLPLPNVSVGKVEDLRAITDKNWGKDNYSVPVRVLPTPPKSSKPKKEGGGDE